MNRVLAACVALSLATQPLAAFAAESAKSAAKDDMKPKSLGGTKDWTAYSAGDKAALVCYIVGHPVKSLPAKVSRGRIALQVTHRPGEKAFNVVSFELGYTAKPGSTADLDVDGKKFSLFTNKDAAWTSDAATDKAVTLAFIKGRQAVIKAVSDRGTTTTDTYSLSGFGHTLALADKACNVKR
jgi:Invasion associated locus B (IalB) protein